jgi:hypothetical protein
MKTLLSIVFIGASVATEALAADLERANQPLMKTGLATAISYSYRDKSYADLGSEWQVPGALMGGESLPVDPYASIDDVVIDYRHALSNNSGFHITAEAHGSNGELQFEFDHYAYKHQWHLEKQSTLRIEAGRLAAKFSPLASFHASKNGYSEATITADIFWGRSLVDNGFRASWLSPYWTLGLEAWNGQNWLTDGGSGADVFARYARAHGRSKYSAGVWGLYANSESRRDTRYFGGHSHGGVMVTSNNAAFSGENIVYGADASFAGGLRSASTLRVEAAVSQFTQDGEVQESDRQAELESDYLSAILSGAWRFRKHEIAARYELLELKNTLSGSAAVLVGTNTSIDNPSGESPSRATLAYRYFHNKHLTLRLEVVDEEVSGRDQTRWVAGLVLRGMFQLERDN